MLHVSYGQQKDQNQQRIDAANKYPESDVTYSSVRQSSTVVQKLLNTRQ